ncbi:MAG: c-type cytochrome, methanol metabolism-related [Rhodobacteraceae bacterium]|nr:c-type cytochrome, methanol metabolism-related [Paracoccaceae bacterium]
MLKLSLAPAAAAAAACLLAAGAAQAQTETPAADNITATHEEDGRYYTADDIPTFHIADDGTVDWLTYSGYRRYHSECHVCHGPDGEGSSYAPALKDSVMQIDYYDFVNVVTNGREHVDSSNTNVMPSFGDNANVMCYLDDIYVYLKARGSGELPRGRPEKHDPKPDSVRAAEKSCLGL